MAAPGPGPRPRPGGRASPRRIASWPRPWPSWPRLRSASRRRVARSWRPCVAPRPRARPRPRPPGGGWPRRSAARSRSPRPPGRRGPSGGRRGPAGRGAARARIRDGGRSRGAGRPGGRPRGPGDGRGGPGRGHGRGRRRAAAGAAALRGRLDALTERLADEERRPIARAARKVGGRRLDEDLAVDPELRAAVEAALADRARAYLVAAASVAELAGERGRLLVEERIGGAGGRGGRRPAAATDAATRRFLRGGRGRRWRATGRGRAAGCDRWRPAPAGAGRLGAGPGGLPRPPGATAGRLDRRSPATGRRSSTTSGSRWARPSRSWSDAPSRPASTTELERADAELGDAAGRRRHDEPDRRDGARAPSRRLGRRRRALSAERRRVEEAERAAARESEAIAREAAWHEAQRSAPGRRD